MATPKVALITGGASGIGLATATAIGQRGGWEVHVLDYNPAAAAAVRDGVPGSVFHAIDITDYAALGATFQAIFRRHRRIDFVFGNAGICEPPDDFYDTPAAAAAAAADDDDAPPPLPASTTRVIDILFTAATATAYLAQHYLARSPPSSARCLVLTASCGGLYPAYSSPVYCAAKHAVVGLVRSIAPVLWRRCRVRANAVLPGNVRTNLLTPQQWAMFPPEHFTPVATVVRAVLVLLDGADPARPAHTAPLTGQCIECSIDTLYYRDAVPYCDAPMAAIMRATDTGK